MDGAFKTYTSLYHSLTQADLDFLIFVQRNKTDSVLCNCQYKNLKPPFDTLICRVKKAENPFAFSVRDYSAFLSSDLPVRMSLMINFNHCFCLSCLCTVLPCIKFFHNGIIGSARDIRQGFAPCFGCLIKTFFECCDHFVCFF